jgi:hypothetical protein
MNHRLGNEKFKLRTPSVNEWTMFQPDKLLCQSPNNLALMLLAQLTHMPPNISILNTPNNQISEFEQSQYSKSEVITLSSWNDISMSTRL